jgi:hypothetical protein
MQMMPATGAELKVGDIRNIESNVHGGAKYMDHWYPSTLMTRSSMRRTARCSRATTPAPGDSAEVAHCAVAICKDGVALPSDHPASHATTRETRMDKRVGSGRRAAAVCLLMLSACSPAPAPPGASAADGWHEFQGSMTAAGSRRTISLGSDRRASAVDLSGTTLLAGPGRPGVGFRVDFIGFNDSATGMIGRAAWTDERGDQVFSELRGQGTATGNHIEGTFTGGTGRYAGASGGYAFSWQYVLESEDGTVQGRAIGLTGRVRIGAPPAAASPEGAKK